MFCSNCGTRLDVLAANCPECGLVIQKRQSVEVAEAKEVSIPLGYLFAFISLLFLPIVFGPIAITMGVKAKNGAQQDAGTTLMIISIILMIFGIIFGAITWINIFA